MFHRFISGEKLTEDECSELFQGQEDSGGNINYEGRFREN